MVWSLKKHLILTIILIASLLLAYFLLILIFSIPHNYPPKSSSSITSSIESGKAVYSCPKDFCGSWVLGSCVGSKTRYRERECYDYPDKATGSSNCEANKRIYYEKGSQPDESC